jgi:uncharacterized protein
MEPIVAFLIRFRKSVIVTMAVITAVFLAMIFRIEMYTVFLDLFPQNHPYVQVHQKYAKYFGGAYMATLVLEVKDGDVWNLETLKKITRITEAVDFIPGVDHFGIYSLSSPKASMVKETPDGIKSIRIMEDAPTDQQGIEEVKKRVFTSTANGAMVSLDGKSLRLDAQFHEGRIDFTDLFNKFMAIKKKEEDANHKIYLSGQPILYGWIYHYLPNMVVILVITSVIILGMLYAYMSQGGLWWWPFIGAVLCSIWGLGFAAILGYHFDPLIIVIPFLLSARAMSHGVQWVERFVEEYRRHEDTKKAALITGTGLFPPGLIGIVADTWALLIIAITPIPTLRNLAFLGTFWAGACIFTVLVLFPPLFASFKTVRVPRKSDVPVTRSYKIEYFTEHVLRRILIRMSSWTFGTGRYITVGLSIAVLILAIVSSLQLKFGDANPGSPILWPDSEYNTDIEKINNRFPGVDQMWVAIVAPPTPPGAVVTYPDVLKGMEALGRYMKGDPNVGFTVSIADLVRSINMLAFGNDPKYETMPTDHILLENDVFLFLSGTTPGEMDTWMTYDASATNVKLYLKNHEGPVLDEVISRVKTFLEANPKLMEHAKPIPAGGLGGILAAANQVIKERNDPVLFFILAVIFVHCSLTYWSILAGVIFTISLVLANFLAFTYMVFKDIGVNINTFPVVSLGIGMGVDYGLYIVSRIIEVYREQEVKDLGEAVKGGMITAGRAVFFTATMMSIGVLAWYFSPLRFQAEMGLLLGVLMMVNMVVGVLVLPAVINIIKPRFITKEARKPTGQKRLSGAH